MPALTCGNQVGSAAPPATPPIQCLYLHILTPGCLPSDTQSVAFETSLVLDHATDSFSRNAEQIWAKGRCVRALHCAKELGARQEQVRSPTRLCDGSRLQRLYVSMYKKHNRLCNAGSCPTRLSLQNALPRQSR